MSQREGNLEAPTRHALDWKNPDFYNQYKLKKQMKTETQTDSSEKVPEDQSPQYFPPSDSLIS